MPKLLLFSPLLLLLTATDGTPIPPQAESVYLAQVLPGSKGGGPANSGPATVLVQAPLPAVRQPQAPPAIVYPEAGKAVGYVRSTDPGKWIVLSSQLIPVRPEILEGGTVCVFQGTPNLSYAVIRIPAGDDQPEVFTVSLGSAPPVPPGPGPNPPPGPGPIPPGPTPPPVLTGWAKLAYDQAKLVPQPYQDVRAPMLAANYEGVGSKLAAGGYGAGVESSQIEAALAEITSKNREALPEGPARTAWVPWLTAWATRAQSELQKQGKQAHVDAFINTAVGLKQIK